MNWFNQPTPLILGHRGASAFAPENSLKAFDLALEQGAIGFEFDVQRTQDGRIVVIHDDDVSRTTNGTGRVSQMSLEQVQTLDAGEGERVPTLDEVFSRYGNKVLYNVEIKDFSWMDRGTEAAVGRLIAQYGVFEQCLISSFNPFSLRRSRLANSSQTKLGTLRYRSAWYDPQPLMYLLAPAEADHPYFGMVDEAYMVWARKRQQRVHVWTVDDPAEAQRLARLGVHGLITNRPGEIKEALK